MYKHQICGFFSITIASLLTHQRFVVSGNRMTGGGISSGLDEALKQIMLLFGDKATIGVQQTTQFSRVLQFGERFL